MKKATRAISFAILVVLAGFSQTVPAQQPNRGTASQVRQTLNALDGDFARFSSSLNIALDNGNTRDSNRREDIDRTVRDFRQSMNQFRSRFDARRADSSDVRDIMQRASDLDRFMQRSQFQGRSQRDWIAVRADL